MNTKSIALGLCSAAALLAGAACDRESSPPVTTAEKPAEAPPTNRVDIPTTVRRNLGITFAKVEVRNVAGTIRIPGRFESESHARREVLTMLNGRVDLKVRRYQEIEAGTLLYTLDSPQWRELQDRLSETDAIVVEAELRLASYPDLLAAHQRHHDALEEAVGIWSERVEQMKQARQSGAVTEAEYARVRGVLATTRAQLAEVLEEEVELKARKQTWVSKREVTTQRFELLLRHASTLTGISPSRLKKRDESSEPLWGRMNRIDVLADMSGTIESIDLTDGSWADGSTRVMSILQPGLVRFRGTAMQSDLARIKSTATARITTPRSMGMGDAINADWQIGLQANPEDRTFFMLASPRERRPWMRPGVSAYLEIVTEGSGRPVLAIPRSAIVKDGLAHVFFRRDPANAGKAIRVEADMGADDGRWVEIKSGLMRGDEVVLDGAYELKLATTTSSTQQKGGHFHADGSFHDDH